MKQNSNVKKGGTRWSTEPYPRHLQKYIIGFILKAVSLIDDKDYEEINLKISVFLQWKSQGDLEEMEDLRNQDAWGSNDKVLDKIWKRQDIRCAHHQRQQHRGAFQESIRRA
ncbi:hypothetical protein S7711_10710 [Stachybotrys chartarum IBT 7711]|uniref:Uncharacterized protein n=1 Tax=Stachybotrys chartarum (strain CBS 109288 / IBT 7711) TaxID=1280523 RepID=A0A084AXY2_STACB|nr:hypothetical protein S7711_10710 [Stachybotrys chartarum IBT 7711]